MQDCNKRCFFAWLQFGGKERLRETKRGEVESAQTCFIIISHRQPGLDRREVSLVHWQSFLSIIACVKFGFTLGLDGERTLSIVNSVKHI